MKGRRVAARPHLGYAHASDRGPAEEMPSGQPTLDGPERRLDERDVTHLEDVLRCATCASSYTIMGAELVCSGCGVRFPIIDVVPVLLKDSTIGTALEESDYDAIHGVTDRVISQTGEQWRDLIEGLGLAGANAVEIGAGSGALTLGLLRENAVARLTATDVSPTFLRMLGSRAGAYRTPLSLIACDANERHFRADAFDLVVGRSILHHLLDYDVTLANCRDMLKPGGAAVFFEPVLEGKTIVTMLLALILRCDQLTPIGEALGGRRA